MKNIGSKGQSIFFFFAVVPPGLESVAAEEISSLGFEPKLQRGGVEFKGTLRDLYRANLWLRTPSRILLRLGSFKALSFSELRARIARYPWEIYFPADLSQARIRVTCRRSRLYHSRAVAERILQGISDRLGREIKAGQGEETPLIVVRLWQNEVLLRLDSSGKDLFKRGYKVAPGPAPLRENLAAALILLSGWKGDSPFWDPFCGTGTIPIEAALLAAQIAPGLNRDFAFQSWRNYDQELFLALREEALTKIKEPEVPILAGDWQEKMIKAAQKNAEEARVGAFISFEKRDFFHCSPPFPKGFLVTNPPYGQRLRQDFETVVLRMKQISSSWKKVFLAPRPKIAKVSTRVLTSFDHGGLKIFVHAMP